MKTKKIPLMTMLSAGAITSIFTYIKNYSTQNMLITLLIVLFVFFIIGTIIKEIIDYFFKPIIIEEETTAKVVEKDLEATENAQSDKK